MAVLSQSHITAPKVIDLTLDNKGRDTKLNRRKKGDLIHFLSPSYSAFLVLFGRDSRRLKARLGLLPVTAILSPTTQAPVRSSPRRQLVIKYISPIL